MVTLQDYASNVPIAWCPGCGNFGILKAVNEALVALGLAPRDVLFVSGIGQGPKLPHYTRGNVFNGLHGRSLPAAQGAKLVNHKLTVIGIDGDGGAYGEGGNHLLAAMRRNVDLTYLATNNQIYGLTKGQASPTSDLGTVTKTTPLGSGEPFRPLAVALASDVTFLARGFAGDVPQLTDLIRAGISHHGFALVDILQPCVSFNHVNTYQWYRERVYKVEDEGHDPSDWTAAMTKAMEWGDRIPTGVIYRKERPVYEDRLPQLARQAVVRQKLDPKQAAPLLDAFQAG
jgi:2-oxoglutarate ferredoxin oxidoreductase subunit beta